MPSSLTETELHDHEPKSNHDHQTNHHLGSIAESEPETGIGAERGLDSTGDTAWQRQATILIVDDSAVDRRFVGMLVEKSVGSRVLFAENGKHALDIVGKMPVDAILTDLQMPEMDGLRLVNAIRAYYPKVPVILMTAHGSHRLAYEALKVGAADFVAKNAIVKELPLTLRRVFKIIEKGKRKHRLLGCLIGQDSRFCLENDPSLISALLEHFREQIDDLNFGDETSRMRVFVALQEALANALYHGNLEVSSDLRQNDEREFDLLADKRRHEFPYRDRRIFIHSRFERDSVLFTIRDEGPGYDTKSVAEPFDPADLLRIGGRGLLLIRTFMDEVTQNEKGNVITMVKYAPGRRGRF